MRNIRKFAGKILLGGIGVLSLFYSCDEREIPVYTGTNKIYFEKFFVNAMYPGKEKADSTIVSYFFFPEGTRDISGELVVLLAGRKLTEDQNFQLRVVEEETTAKPEEYTLASEYTFHANSVNADSADIRDVIKVDFHWSERLKTMDEGIRLVVELVPNDNFELGQIERIRAKILLTIAAARPVWWNDEVTNNLLGTYSEKKFYLFLNEIDKKAEMSSDLIKNHPDQAIKLVLQFKEWLRKNPQTEVDGSVMEVKI